MSVRKQADAKAAIFDDPRKGSFASANCQRAGVILPANGNQSVLAFLVLVAVAPIFIKIEFPIGSTINAKLDQPCRILRSVLDLRTIGTMESARMKRGNRSRGASASISRFPSSIHGRGEAGAEGSGVATT